MINKFIFKFSKDGKKHIFLSVCLNVLALIANILLTAGFVFIIKSVMEGDFSRLLYIVIISAVLIIIRYLSVRNSQILAYKASEKIKSHIRVNVFEKNARLKKGKKASLAVAEISQLALEGVEQTEMYTSVFVPQLFYSLISIMLVFTLLCFINLKTALVLLACIPAIPVSVMAVVKFAKKLFKKYWSKYTEMGGDFLDNVHGMTALKIYQADELMNEKMNKRAEAFRKITMSVLSMQLNSITFMDAIAFGGAAIGIVVGLSEMLNHGLTVYNALFCTLISAEFFLPLRALGSAFHIAMNGITTTKKIESFLNLEEENPDGKSIDNDNFSISFEGVSFSYDQKPVIKNLDMKLEKNQFVFLVGESGSGKSTIAGLITGMLIPTEGKVKINDIEIKDYDFFELNQKILCLRFDSRIFKGTIRDNLLLANENATNDGMLVALKKARLYDFVCSTNEHLDYALEENGSNLSGGQRQRLALARMFLANADLYIFDEALSSVDADNEREILEHIKKLTQNATVLFITHKLICAENSDKIYVLSNGECTSGSHQELMNKKDESYARMYLAQQKILALGEEK
ncbi:MAG: ABC transporter ATP-binding protein/permease [Christensenellaceae bacterium]|nr:ABC transporter ATP-binding protein/permease [Christensenellaceae bacterium]